jgi:predicted small secreted protein
MMKRPIFLLGLGLAIAITLVFAVRLSDEALAMVIGFILGALASIPTSLMVTLILRQRDTASPERSWPAPSHMASQQPPIFIVTGSGASPVPSPFQGTSGMPILDGRRTFTVVGDESTEA